MSLIQKGFTSFETVLLIVIATLIIGVGYFVYHHNQKSDKTTTASVTKFASNEHGKNQSASQGEQQYLLVKQWNVKLPLSAGIRDAYYQPSTYYGTDGNPSGFKDDAMDLGTKSLTKLDSQCAPGETSPGALVRQTISQHDTNVANNKQGKTQTDLEQYPVYRYRAGNYYYDSMSPQAGCSSSADGEASNAQVKDTQLFTTAVKGIKVVE